MIPNGTSFIGISTSANLKERRSALSAKTTTPYTIEDIQDSINYVAFAGTRKIDTDITFLGDSITANPLWWTKNLLEKVSFKSFNNLARSGATWTNTVDTVYDITSDGGSTTDDNTIWNQINKLIYRVSNNLQPVPETIVILAGTNDYNRPRGSAETTFVADYPLTTAPNAVLTLSDAIRFNCEFILSSFPHCQIIITTPIQIAYQDNQVIFAIGDMIKSTVKELSIQSIDLGREVGIYGKKEAVIAIDLVDGLHPNSFGNEKIGAFMAKRLTNLINV